ncbi:MAG: excisionase family DNA-binding protein [Candidatus Marinimicrobia bacterium]|nr:excisionase family DNA-binding protein [Candidatus Neomarinimicrobiota bacterium]
MKDNWITMNQACRYVWISSRTIHRAMKKGQIRYVKIGRLIRFKKTWLDAWVLGFGPRLTASQKLIMNKTLEGN